MTNSQKNFILLILITFVFSLQTLGFDLYHHVLSLTGFSSISKINYDYILFNYNVPRYFWFHYIFYIPTLLGVPLVVSLIISYYWILKALFKAIQNTSTFVFYTTLFLSFILTLFWAPLSMSVLLVITYYFSNKQKFLYFSFVFHPVGLLLAIITGLFRKEYKLFLYVVTSFILLIIFVNTNVSDIKCTNLVFDFRNLDEASNESMMDLLFKKWKEMIIIVMVFFLGHINNRQRIKNKKTAFLKKTSPLKLYLVLAISSAVFSINKQIGQKSPGLYSFLIYDYDYKVYEIFNSGWMNFGVPEDKVCYYTFFRKFTRH